MTHKAFYMRKVRPQPLRSRHPGNVSFKPMKAAPLREHIHDESVIDAHELNNEFIASLQRLTTHPPTHSSL
ncbi:hypothetical protein EYF80_040969 [Liparis tanakae]|uniref:Uncharacterized protein n=1 Tax=Liparis tanakae TaxID=230148 RepID=A0A4Z2G6V2_9TELE|nr:hypothetical protein EYF80_040969 [Liparis tanakae]